MAAAAQVMTKTPVEARPYTHDFSNELETGDTITGAVITATPSDLGVGTPVISTDKLKVQAKYSSGADEGRYDISAVVTTAAGYTYELCGTLVVQAC
jgi:hypothetical protein